MQKIVNGIWMEYEKQDENLAKEVLKELKKKSQGIMKFFELEEVKDLKIKIWDDYDAYKEHLLPYLKANKEESNINWITAHTNDGNINMLPKRFVEKIWNRKVANKELAIEACHEFVHICQQKCLGDLGDDNGWFWEALATNLGNPEEYDDWVKNEYEEHIDWKKFGGFENFSEGSYKYVYCIGKYMLNNISHKRILEYVKKPEELTKEQDLVLEKAITYSNKTFSKKTKQNCELYSAK